ncbi:DUF1269 domain-containing protein [Methylocystis sp. IM3]|uniref:DUF1269 domain-containing protein n=1 Tax=unclassified Methylocystis TaxID=2625913 RepID=UPI0030FB4E77
MVIRFATEEQAEGVRDKMLQLPGEHAITLSDALIVAKRSDGTLKLIHLFEPGRMWHLLTSVMGYPAPNWFTQLSVAWQNVEFDENALNQVITELPAGSAVIFVLVKQTKLDKFLPILRGTGGSLVASSFSKPDDNTIRVDLAG